MARPKPTAPPWQPGQSGNPAGRPIGSRNKLNEKFILALHDDFTKHGVKVIEEVREKRPEIYLKVVASLLPRELHFKSDSAFEGMSNEQLDEMLGSIRGLLSARTPEGSGAREPAPRRSKPTDSVH